MASAKIVNVGLAGYAGLIINSGQAVFKYGQIGTGVTAVSATDTTLGTPTADARVSGTQSRVTTSVTNDTVQNVYTITSGAGGAITECGDFDALTSGSMSDRAVFAVVTLSAGDSIQITGKTQLTSAT